MKTDTIGCGNTATTLATCWKLIRRDGTVMGFTDFSRPLTIDGTTYEAKTGYASTTIVSTAGLAVDNQDIEGSLSSDSITEADITAGKYQFAVLQIFQVNYMDLSAGKKILRTGFLGELTRGDHTFKAEIRGLAQMAVRNIGQLYAEKCRADLGDSRCCVNMETFTQDACVVATNGNAFTIAVNRPAGYYSNGKATFTSGPNAGVSVEISSHTKDGNNDVLTPFLPLHAPLAVGTTLIVQAGCSKEYSVCRNIFNNYLNFRGEPGIPGTDKIYAYPTHRS